MARFITAGSRLETQLQETSQGDEPLRHCVYLTGPGIEHKTFCVVSGVFNHLAKVCEKSSTKAKLQGSLIRKNKNKTNLLNSSNVYLHDGKSGSSKSQLPNKYSHCLPTNILVSQTQEYDWYSSTHVPPFIHGLLKHKFESE